jgi:hypothetical protein
VLGQETKRETKWSGLCRRHSRRHIPLDVPNGRGYADGEGGAQRRRGAGGGASGPNDLGRRLGHRHSSRGVDAWQIIIITSEVL